ncbi:DUF624 domain-containing protein [Jeotgalibacillus marinus]|uniref:DUF624 domain-containing protein n=1 Tax=Jeotgalibacillus marinus TaxID=86667 RepID=A0ABV3Q613_9BACL
MKKGFLGVMEMFASFVLLNIMLFFYSLLFVTFIPALAATMEIMHKWKKEGLTPYFLKSFHSSFKKHAHATSLLISGIWIAGLVVLALDAWFSATIVMPLSDVLYVFSVLFFFIWLLMLPYIIVQVMRVDLTIRGVLKNSFFLLWIEWKRTFLMLLVLILLSVGIMMSPFILIISGSLFAISIYSIFLPIISTYYLSPKSREVYE